MRSHLARDHGSERGMLNLMMMEMVGAIPGARDKKGVQTKRSFSTRPNFGGNTAKLVEATGVNIVMVSNPSPMACTKRRGSWTELNSRYLARNSGNNTNSGYQGEESLEEHWQLLSSSYVLIFPAVLRRRAHPPGETL